MQNYIYRVFSSQIISYHLAVFQLCSDYKFAILECKFAVISIVTFKITLDFKVKRTNRKVYQCHNN